MQERDTVRMVLMDEQKHVLLLRIHDTVPVYREWPNNKVFWVMPGGGVEAGETFEVALVREAREEIGLYLDSVGPCVWTEQPVLQFSDAVVRFNTRYYFVPIKYHPVDFSGMPEGERVFVRDFRWWSLNDIRTTDEILLPPGLPELLEPLVNGDLPTEPVNIARL